LEVGFKQGRKAVGFMSLFGGRTSPSAEQVVDLQGRLTLRQEREVEENRKCEEIRMRWKTILSCPAHEYFADLLQEAGLPTDVTQVVGHVCSFWRQPPDLVVGEPVAAMIIRIQRIRTSLYLYFQDDQYVIFREGKWSMSRGVKDWDVLQFCVL
jgi:hypothetical protein